MHTRTKTILLTVVLALGWSGAIAFGLRTLLNYESTPGAVGAVPQSWPAKSKLPRALDRPTLVMLAHPRCPCTRASVNELAHVLAVTAGKVCAYVLFIAPNESPEWKDSGLRQSAEAIPGVTVLSDDRGVEAKLFGAETSGETLLFDSQGKLVFNGGITASRGHEGGNAGENALVSLIKGQPTAHAVTLVFGCSLKGRNQKAKQIQCPR